ncbi:MlaE family ABC transporter permease [Pelagibacterium montanilacus]|uniref:MlaE family ABC transporter permease n=1 Tax=Pelagibacterium montanilacus TaxID=2185280 RepID=UPI0013E0BD19|nr:ABC transporter permease [Pelagibacterium montanilacus]
MRAESDGAPAYKLSGAWTSAHARTLERAVDAARSSDRSPVSRIDMGDVLALDTIGAWLVLGLGGRDDQAARPELVNAEPRHLALIERIKSQPPAAVQPAPTHQAWFVRPFDTLGRLIVGAGEDIVRLMAVLGQILVSLVTAVLHRGPSRASSYVNQFDLIILRAVPIVVLIALVVGAIITQQSILQLRNFGVAIYVVDLGAILMLREVGLLLAAIMIAGRSGSAITAEIGSMRMREEIDALSVMGVDPYRALVLPRMVALVVGLPLLSFIAALAGLVGTAIVAQVYGDIPFDIFLERLQSTLNMRTLLVGLVKAPVMALIIGLVAINEGFKVQGSAESLGRHTTASVVRAIFLVIVADGLFAMFFAAIGF